MTGKDVKIAWIAVIVFNLLCVGILIWMSNFPSQTPITSGTKHSITPETAEDLTFDKKWSKLTYNIFNYKCVYSRDLNESWLSDYSS